MGKLKRDDRSDNNDESEEARRNRQIRKEKRKLKRELKLQQATAYVSASGYSNNENPFNDANLGQKFVWEKKLVGEIEAGATSSELARKDALKKADAQQQLEELARKRLDRIEMQKEREVSRNTERIIQDVESIDDWELREDQFHLNQAIKRAQIRIKDGRAKAIDILAMNLAIATDKRSEMNDQIEGFDSMGLEMDITEPYLITQNLTPDELRDLHFDVKLYISLEKDAKNLAFWQAMQRIVEHELNISKANHGIDSKIMQDINRMLDKKNLKQLESLEIQINSKLKSGKPIDVEYWETLLKSLLVWKSKAKLREMYNFMVEQRNPRIASSDQTADMKSAPFTLPADMESLPFIPPAEVKTVSSMYATRQQIEVSPGVYIEIRPGVSQSNPIKEYDRCMSPVIMRELGREDQKIDLVVEQEDYSDLLELRRYTVKLRKQTSQRSGPRFGTYESDPMIEAMISEASAGLGQDEEVFLDEMLMDGQNNYVWQDKYRPRKPRFFNRVATGFEWNKYNKVHYDEDNPPPKLVQGYKFNIFYPDLIDKSLAPSYKIERDEGYPETVLIRFAAGPPYEDVAFRIVNKEWEYGHKRGFVCAFDRGVLLVHFKFKKLYYKRG